MKYSIGIDLGTTNCALAYQSLDNADTPSQIVDIPQWQSPGSLIEQDTLPSFLYLPTATERPLFASDAGSGQWVPGVFARKQAADRPEAVAHSVKSWLCHQAVDRSQPILPWGSSEVEGAEKLSPITASALLLNYLRHVWDTTMTGNDPDARFDAQKITVTVPASFDAAAQNLTLEAAKTAGFPSGVALLEEPQAAFYRWLECHPETSALMAHLPGLSDRPQHIVVVDIGGGTSDFSLFEIRGTSEDALPTIKRIAVSDHILLGGDNIDLAIAHLIEPRFSPENERGTLSPKQWSYLVARCRDLKEQVLSESEPDDDRTYSISVPTTGSGLVAGTQTAGIQHSEVSRILFRGFFQRCGLTEIPDQPRTALREMGLPYAADSAITRHLAAFLNDRPPVDAILFNGGTLSPALIQQHLVEQIAAWQDGNTPVVLENPDPNLAVARGAAFYGALVHQQSTRRIESGAARAVYLEIGNAAPTAPAGQRSLICILPRDTQPGEKVIVTTPGLQLRLNRKVAFQPWYARGDNSDKAGALTTLDPTRFRRLPPLHTIASEKDVDDETSKKRIDVELHSQLNEVGLLNIACVDAVSGNNQSWPLEFDLQAVHGEPEADTRSSGSSNPPKDDTSPDPGVDEDHFNQARERITQLLGKPSSRKDPVTPSRLLKSLETILQQPKHEWNGFLVRGLWPALHDSFEHRSLSIEHEETWISIAGFLLRPGYGAPLDETRIDQLWNLHTTGLAFPGKRNQIQAHVLWRRVAGGLSAPRQLMLLEPELQRLREAKNPPADLVRLAGALERLDIGIRRELVELFLNKGAAIAADGGHAGPYFAALTALLSRTPLYAGAETVLPAQLVEQAFEACRNLDWEAPTSMELRGLFLRSARLTGDRHLDVAKSLSKQLYAKLEKAGVAPAKLNPLRSVVPLARADQAQLFEEGLPPGLSLGR